MQSIYLSDTTLKPQEDEGALVGSKSRVLLEARKQDLAALTIDNWPRASSNSRYCQVLSMQRSVPTMPKGVWWTRPEGHWSIRGVNVSLSSWNPLVWEQFVVYRAVPADGSVPKLTPVPSSFLDGACWMAASCSSSSLGKCFVCRPC